MIGNKISHFHVLSRIGGGGMGTVFKAEDTRLPGRIVALKLLNPDLVGNEQLKKRFLLEAQAATSLDHPNICEIFEVDETDEGRLFMSMRYYGGATLRHRMSDAPLGALEAFQIGYSIAQGLHAAHRRDIIHRDIKPANIMVTEDGYVKIVDFGLAKLLGRTKVTASGVTVGTAAYMSPEQADGREVDGRTDIWSLGVVLYEMVTGRLPFRGEVDHAIIYSILNEDFTPVRELNPDVPEECARIIEKCLAKDRDQRYPSTEALLEDMHKAAEALGWSSQLSVATIAPVSWVAHRIDRRRRWQRVVSGIATTIVIAVAAFFYWYLNREPSPYVTDVRLAVMPFQSRIGPDYDALAAGLSEVVSDALEEISFQHKSMWVVPGYFVPYADPPGPREAGLAFGANIILTGEIQRYENGRRLSLQLRDASSENTIWSDAVDFDSTSVAALPAGAAAVLADHFRVSPPLAETKQLASLPPDVARTYIAARGQVWSDPETAITKLESVCSAAPRFGLAHTYLGWARFRNLRGDMNDAEGVDRAITTLREGRSVAPGDYHSNYFLGEALRYNSQLDSAIASFKSASGLSPKAFLPRRGLGRAYFSQGRLDESDAALLAGIATRSDFYADFKELGTLCYYAARYDTALHWLTRAVELAPEDVTSLNALGGTCHELGDFQTAATMFQRAFRISPNCDNCNNVGLMHFYAGRYRDAANYYELAMSYCDSTDYGAWGNWGVALYWAEGAREQATGVLQVAIELAEKSLARSPDNSDILVKLLEYNTMCNQWDVARNYIERVKPYSRSDPEMLYRIGCAYEMMGDRNQALEYLGDALRHKLPAEIPNRTPELQDLVKDARFQQMVESLDGG